MCGPTAQFEQNTVGSASSVLIWLTIAKNAQNNQYHFNNVYICMFKEDCQYIHVDGALMNQIVLDLRLSLTTK